MADPTTPVYDYAAGRNDGHAHATSIQNHGVPQGSQDSVPGGSDYVQGFSDGVTLANSGYNANGSKQA